MIWVIKKARHLSMSSLLHAQVCFSAQHYVCIVLARVFTIVECRSGVHTTSPIIPAKKSLAIRFEQSSSAPIVACVRYIAGALMSYYFYGSLCPEVIFTLQKHEPILEK